MKKIKGRRVIGLLLILCLFISSLSLLASAAEPTKQQILVVVDLSDYQGDITGAIKLGNAEVELTAGQRNEFLIPSAGFSTSSVTLTDFPAGEQTENYNCWTVSGLDESYTRFSSSDHTYSIHAMTTMDRPVITMQGNTLTFVSGIRLSILRRKDNWGGGTTVTITPKAPAKVDNVSAASSDESKGTAGVMYKRETPTAFSQNQPLDMLLTIGCGTMQKTRLQTICGKIRIWLRQRKRLHLLRTSGSHIM